MLGGKCFDLLAAITRKKLTISSVRVKKILCHHPVRRPQGPRLGIQRPYTLGQGLERTLRFEFIEPPKDDITFKSE